MARRKSNGTKSDSSANLGFEAKLWLAADKFPLVAPPTAIFDAFNRDCQPLLDRILSNHGESRSLATLRDTLLPKLLSGELSVRAASAEVDAAA